MALSNEKKQSLLKDIELANEVVQKRHKEVLATYSKAVIVNPRAASWLAIKLSERYKTMRVTLSYENGQQSITAEPVFKPFAPNHDYVQLADQAKQAFEWSEKAASDLWPTYDQIVAYAQGYNDASPAKEEYESMKKEVDVLRKDRSFGPYGYPPPWRM